MNLQEQVSGIKTIMGLIKEDVDDACKLKDINLPMYYWDATNDKEISNKIYDEESLYNFHKKYN